MTAVGLLAMAARGFCIKMSAPDPGARTGGILGGAAHWPTTAGGDHVVPTRRIRRPAGYFRNRAALTGTLSDFGFHSAVARNASVTALPGRGRAQRHGSERVVADARESGMTAQTGPAVVSRGGGQDASPAGLPRILLVEDHAELGEELVATLGRYGMDTAWATEWPQALDLLRAGHVDVVILDQWLGRIDTLARLAELRALTAAWIVILTANRAEVDRIVALEVGADDFLLKPVSGRELVARIRAHLRRQDTPPTLRAGSSRGWRVMPVERCVHGPDGVQVPLTSTEFTLLQALMETPGSPVERDGLSLRVLKREHRAEDRALDNLVHNIRRKIPVSAGRAPIIVSVRNQGYVFTGFPDEQDASLSQHDAP